MILLDTNVVVEVMRRRPAAVVIDWLNRVDAASLYLSTITIAEIVYGICSLSPGRRREQLLQRFEDFIERGFTHRVVGFDESAASRYGELTARRRELGRPMSFPDGQIASIASIHQFAIATRDGACFDGIGLELINPWVPR